MNDLSRRRFCALAALAPLAALPPRFAFARLRGQSQETADLPAEVLHGQGVRMLREGRSFEKAAARFALAAIKEPENPAHPLAQGCALASRVASLGRAADWTNILERQQADYPARLKEWEAGRADWEADKARWYPNTNPYEKYEDSKPLPPSFQAIVTKDDKAPFRLTPPELAARLSELSKRAQEAWEKGIALGKTPDEKAFAYYTQAWGLSVLFWSLLPFSQTGEFQTNDANPAPGLPYTPQPADWAKAAEEAARLAPERALYVQAVGDLLPYNEKEKAAAAYEKAVSLAPKDRNLLFLVYQKTMQKAGSKGQKPGETFAIPLDFLHRAASRDRANAWYLYEEAALLFRPTPYAKRGRSAADAPKPTVPDAALADADRVQAKRALGLVAQGNALPTFALPVYKSSLPLLLQAGWKMTMAAQFLSNENFDSFERLRELGRALSGYADVMAVNNAPEALRAVRLGLAMGFQIISASPLRNDFKNEAEALTPFIGAGIVNTIYRGFIKTLQKTGGTSSAAALQTEFDTFQKWNAEFRRTYHNSGADPFTRY